MKIEQGNYNVLRGTLNVFDRLSDRGFVISHWPDETYSYRLPTYYSLQECYLILEDYFFFDLLIYEYGVWKNIVSHLPNNIIIDLVNVAREFESYVDKHGVDILVINDWEKVLYFSQIALNSLMKFLGIKKEDYFLLDC